MSELLNSEQVIEYCKDKIEKTIASLNLLEKDVMASYDRKLGDKVKQMNDRLTFYKSVAYIIEFNTILDPQELEIPELEIELLENYCLTEGSMPGDAA